MKSDNSKRLLLIENSNSTKCPVSEYDTVYTLNGNLTRAKNLPWDFMDMADQHTACFRARRTLEAQEDLLLPTRVTDVFNLAFQNQQGFLTLKKELLLSLENIHKSFIFAEKFISKFDPSVQIDFVPIFFPNDLSKIVAKEYPKLCNKVQFPDWRVEKFLKKNTNQRWLFSSILFFYPIALGLFIPMFHRKRKQCLKYSTVIFVSDAFIHSICQYFVDYLLDNNLLRQKDLLFVGDGKMGSNGVGELSRKYANFCQLRALTREIDCWQYWRDIYPTVRTAYRHLGSLRREDTHVLNACLKSLRSIPLWNIFERLFHVENSLAIQTAGSIPRMLMQKQLGIRTLFIYLSSNFFPIEFNGKKSSIVENYDTMIYGDFISSRIAIDYFQNNDNFIQQYHETGILLSDIVYQTHNDEVFKLEVKKQLGIPSDKIVVCFCDTKIGPAGWLTDDEGIQITKDILRLIEDRPNIFLICCPKGDYANYPRESKIWHSRSLFLEAQRCLYNVPGKSHYRTQNIMGISDLVVSSFASSTGFEALAGGKKSLFYAPNNRYRNNTHFANSIPNFCAYGYEQLADSVDYWLTQRSYDDVRELQAQYLKGTIDSFCDGQAIERFIKILDLSHGTHSQPL